MKASASFFVLLHSTLASFSWQSGVKNIVVLSYLNNSYIQGTWHNKNIKHMYMYITYYMIYK